MLENVSIKLRNDIHLSTCFTLLLTTVVTQTHIQKTITVSIQKENENYTVDGYVCFSVLYVSLSLAMWLSPAVLVIFGRKLTMIIGVLCNIPFVSACYFENVLFTYTSAAITGIGSAFVWTGQANYLVLNSEVGNVYQSVSLFWMFSQCSNFMGNAFVYFQFHDITTPIDRPMRLRIVLMLLTFVLLSFLMMCFLRPPIRHEEDEKRIRNPLNEIGKAFKILMSPSFLILSTMFFYSGIHLTFLSVAGASMGFSKYLSANSKEFAPLSGIFQGIGEIAGSIFALYFTKKKATISNRIRPLLIVAGLVNFVSYIVYFLGLPDSSSFTYTEQMPIIRIPVNYLIASHLLIGLGDACIYIELYQCLGALYPGDSAPAFAIFKFTRSLAIALSFYYSNLLGLYMQLIILCVSGIFGIISHHYVLNVSKVIARTSEIPTA